MRCLLIASGAHTARIDSGEYKDARCAVAKVAHRCEDTHGAANTDGHVRASYASFVRSRGVVQEKRHNDWVKEAMRTPRPGRGRVASSERQALSATRNALRAWDG